jgi:pyruvate kinase
VIHTYRHTKIIATLGPTTEKKSTLVQLIEAGVDVMRLNMAHASHEWVAEVIWHIREVSHQVGRDVAIMMDVKGPEIRTGKVDSPIPLQAGAFIELHTAAAESVATEIPSIPVNYAGLPADVRVGEEVLVDSGLIRLRVVDKDETHIRAQVITPGLLGSRRHINLPGVHVRLPALTAKDELDVRAGVAAGIDFIALSFVRDAEAVRTLRTLLDELGSPAKIVAKIEDQAGVRNNREIIHAADAVMVARGDLGIEIEYHKLPLVQTELVRACQAEGKPVIIATQLLESMISSPMPTRAEISDVCNAVREQADAVMLSGETATGAYPLESIQVLKNIIRSIEPSLDNELNTQFQLLEPKAKMLRSAAVLAQELGQSGIVVFTRSGYLAYALGALRARGVPIFAFTDVEATFRQCMLPWGVEPFRMKFSDDPETTIVDALNYLKKSDWCPAGTWLVVITNALASTKIIDTLQLRQIDS